MNDQQNGKERARQRNQRIAPVYYVVVRGSGNVVNIGEVPVLHGHLRPSMSSEHAVALGFDPFSDGSQDVGLISVAGIGDRRKQSSVGDILNIPARGHMSRSKHEGMCWVFTASARPRTSPAFTYAGLIPGLPDWRTRT